MRRFALLLVVLAAVSGAVAGQADAALKYPLHYGNRGKAVCNAEWLLAQRGKPGAYRQPYYQVWKKKIRRDGKCPFDLDVANAVVKMKTKLGYCPPVKGRPSCRITSRFDYTLRDYLTGKQRRSNLMQRTALLRRHPPKNCEVGDNVVRLARAEVGQREYPWGSNSGVRVRFYESSTGAYGAAWCASFAQKILQLAGIGPIADRSAGVGYIAEYARRRGWLRNEIRPGYLITWGSRHMGVIDSAIRTAGGKLSGFYVIEGNASNQVMRRFYRYGLLGGWLIKPPGIDRRIRCA